MILGRLVFLVIVLILVEISLEIVVINLLDNLMVSLTDSKCLTAFEGNGLCPFDSWIVATL